MLACAVFAMMLVTAKGPAGRPFEATQSTQDKAALAALDTEYQAAVKKNDVATMDRLLADDFILVTGSGKTYNKADLLNFDRMALCVRAIVMAAAEGCSMRGLKTHRGTREPIPQLRWPCSLQKIRPGNKSRALLERVKRTTQQTLGPNNIVTES
jgi:hypothetical protein